MPKDSKKKHYIESGSENESVSNNESDTSDEEVDEPEVDEPEVDEPEVVEPEVVQVNVKKITKQKLTYYDIKDSITELRTKRDILIEENDEYIKNILINNREIKRINKEITKKDKVVDKIYIKDIKVAGKEKRKRTKPNTGGICEPREVPQILRKYIGKELLPDTDLLMKRHEVCKLFHAALNRDKQKSDRNIVISKKSVAKALCVEKGKIVEFKEQPTFLASFYK